MAKIFFVGDGNLMEHSVSGELEAELRKVLVDIDQAEFLFCGCHDAFTYQALTIVILLKEEYPEKQFTVTSIIDPVLAERGTDAVSPGIFGRSMKLPYNADRTVYAPEFPLKSDKLILTHSRRITRWAVGQCSILFTYYYPNLPSPACHLAGNAAKHVGAEIHHLYMPDTLRRINELIEMLPERQRDVLQMSNSGMTYREVGNSIGVSANRAQQLAGWGARKVRDMLRDEGILSEWYRPFVY